MSLALASFAIWPAPMRANAGGTMTLSSADHKAAAVWRVGKTGSIRKVHFRLATVTTGETLRASLQDVDAGTGDPDGAQDQSGTVSVANGDSNTWKSVTMDSDRAVNRGEWLACVVQFNSAAGNLQVASDNDESLFGSLAYRDQYTTSWTKSDRAPILAVEYADGSFDVQPGLCPGVQASVTFNAGTSPYDEYGMRFTLPFPARCLGLWLHASLTADCDFVLYEGTTPLATVHWDNSIAAATTVARRAMLFASSVELSAGAVYRITMKPGASNVTFRFLNLFSAAAGAILPGGVACHLTKRVDEGSWTDDDTQRPLMALLLDAFHDGTGGAGPLLRHPGMSGGILG